MFNNSLANVLIAKGAGAVYGYDDYVLSSYAQNVSDTIITEMIETDATFGEAVDAAIAMHGADDGDGADLVTLGADDLKLSDGTLNNLDFESGFIEPWQKEGDGRLITQLGSASPTQGSGMGIISTGLGFTTESGTLSQQGCLAESVTTLSLDWNFFSEEFLEFCNSEFDDQFFVEMCDNTDESESCTTLFETGVNTLCANESLLTPVAISFDQGDVYATGWQSQNADISAFAGKPVTLRLHSTDVGDSIYDTAILLDNIRIE